MSLNQTLNNLQKKASEAVFSIQQSIHEQVQFAVQTASNGVSSISNTTTAALRGTPSNSLASGTASCSAPGQATVVTVTIAGHSNLQPLQRIGEGAFSFVQLFRPLGDSGTGSGDLAGKYMRIDKEQLKNVQNEIHLMKELPVDHPNFVRYRGSQIDPVRHSNTNKQSTEMYEAWILMDVCRGPSLVQQMQQMKAQEQRFPVQVVRDIFVSVARALHVLHHELSSSPVAHRDVKVENVLIGEDGNYKLIDFGSCTTTVYKCTSQKEVSVAQLDIEKHTTLSYRAPEAVDPWQRLPIDWRQDIWALGVLLYYIMFFKLPFEESALAISTGKYTIPPGGTDMLLARSTSMEADRALVEILCSIIAMCLKGKPDERPSTNELLALLKCDSFLPSTAMRTSTITQNNNHNKDKDSSVHINQAGTSSNTMDVDWFADSTTSPTNQTNTPLEKKSTPAQDAFSAFDAVFSSPPGAAERQTPATTTLPTVNSTRVSTLPEHSKKGAVVPPPANHTSTAQPASSSNASSNASFFPDDIFGSSTSIVASNPTQIEKAGSHSLVLDAFNSSGYGLGGSGSMYPTRM